MCPEARAQMTLYSAQWAGRVIVLFRGHSEGYTDLQHKRPNKLIALIFKYLMYLKIVNVISKYYN